MSSITVLDQVNFLLGPLHLQHQHLLQSQSIAQHQPLYHFPSEKITNSQDNTSRFRHLIKTTKYIPTISTTTTTTTTTTTATATATITAELHQKHSNFDSERKNNVIVDSITPSLMSFTTTTPADDTITLASQINTITTPTINTTNQLPQRKKGMKRRLLGFIARSPHIMEIISGYILPSLVFMYMSFTYLEATISEFTRWTLFGLVLYTLMEYWFHRIILHNFLEGAHHNHHRKPRNLRIITTPLIPVLIVEHTLIYLLKDYIGTSAICALNAGIAVGQLTMDSVHFLFHSRFRPKILESARSYHMYHHFCQEDLAHGLTTSFWDMVFGTLPKANENNHNNLTEGKLDQTKKGNTEWRYYKDHQWLRWVQLPVPLLGFVILSLYRSDLSVNQEVTKDSKNTTTTTTTTTTTSRWTDFGHPSLKNLIFAFFAGSSILVISWPHLVKQLMFDLNLYL